MPTIKAAANMSVVWGTKTPVGMAGADATIAPSGMILESLNVTPKDGDPTEIEDGDGLTAIEVGLENGFDAKASAVYDPLKILPLKGDPCTIRVPYSDGVTPGLKLLYVSFWSAAFTRSRKKEAMIEMNFHHRPLINTPDPAQS